MLHSAPLTYIYNLWQMYHLAVFIVFLLDLICLLNWELFWLVGLTLFRYWQCIQPSLFCTLALFITLCSVWLQLTITNLLFNILKSFFSTSQCLTLFNYPKCAGQLISSSPDDYKSHFHHYIQFEVVFFHWGIQDYCLWLFMLFICMVRLTSQANVLH